MRILQSQFTQRKYLMHSLESNSVQLLKLKHSAEDQRELLTDDIQLILCRMHQIYLAHHLRDHLVKELKTHHLKYHHQNHLIKIHRLSHHVHIGMFRLLSPYHHGAIDEHEALIFRVDILHQKIYGLQLIICHETWVI